MASLQYWYFIKDSLNFEYFAVVTEQRLKYLKDLP